MKKLYTTYPLPPLARASYLATNILMVYLYEPSGFTKEIKYLRDRGITTVKFKDGKILNLDEVDLSKMDWSTKRKY
ncbi:hypothetical protein [uncultured Winogradskyella sp.]|uniref:hypothetical protein n=1 Tax=uncultured Winogradskyella sp. TaxID=395353 RepID=UPI0030D94775